MTITNGARRNFILLNASFVAAYVIAELVTVQSPDIESRILQIFKNTNSAKAIGTEYINSLPEIATAQEFLAKFLNSEPKAGVPILELSHDELLINIRQKISADFELGRTNRVGGWIFAETELLLFSFVALQS